MRCDFCGELITIEQAQTRSIAFLGHTACFNLMEQERHEAIAAMEDAEGFPMPTAALANLRKPAASELEYFADLLTRLSETNVA